MALGEQEYSDWRFRWIIANHGADIVQPDLFYYGGMIRSLRVARMAELARMPTTVHISASLRTGAVTLTDACSGTCTRSRTVASAESPLVGDITYRVDHVDSSTGQTVVDADLTIHVDLGTSTVKADYEPATS